MHPAALGIAIARRMHDKHNTGLQSGQIRCVAIDVAAATLFIDVCFVGPLSTTTPAHCCCNCERVCCGQGDARRVLCRSTVECCSSLTRTRRASPTWQTHQWLMGHEPNSPWHVCAWAHLHDQCHRAPSTTCVSAQSASTAPSVTRREGRSAHSVGQTQQSLGVGTHASRSRA